MARMIPFEGPVTNDSHIAEPMIYQALAEQLPEDFTVIHSLPWLSQAVKEFDGRNVPLGEIDFLILHPALGILALEVKGGTLRAERHRLVVERTGKVIDPVSQVSRGAFALSRWLEGAGQPVYKMGYAIAFPQSDLRGRLVPPGLVDMSLGFPQAIYIDRPSLSDMGRRVIEIMRYWQQASRISPVSQEKICAIVDLLCPLQDYSLRWLDRIQEDKDRWLVLTAQQSRYLERFTKQQRVVLNGGSGTGKTLLAVTHARRLTEKGQRVLFLVYNVPLTAQIRHDLAGTSVTVLGFYALCRQAAIEMGFLSLEETPNWYQDEGPNALSTAIHARVLPEYDALVLDEAQVFHHEWLSL